jgi:hypothetical protein
MAKNAPFLKGNLDRAEKWTESVAVDSESFVNGTRFETRVKCKRQR